MVIYRCMVPNKSEPTFSILNKYFCTFRMKSPLIKWTAWRRGVCVHCTVCTLYNVHVSFDKWHQVFSHLALFYCILLIPHSCALNPPTPEKLWNFIVVGILHKSIIFEEISLYIISVAFYTKYCTEFSMNYPTSSW